MAKQVANVRYIDDKQQKKEPLIDKIMGGAAKFTGAAKLAEMIEPIAEYGTIKYMEKINPAKAEKMKLRQPASKASQAMETGGLGAATTTIAGQGLEAAADLSMFATGGLGKGLTNITKGAGFKKNLLGFANSFTGRSAEIAFTKSVGADLQKEGENNGVSEILYDATINGMIAGATSYALGKAFTSLTRAFSNSSARVTARNYEVPYKMVENDVKYGNKTIAHKMSELGYVGTKKQVIAKSLAEKTKVGAKIGKTLENKSGTVLKENVVKDVTKMFDDNIVLEESQLNLIMKQINKIPDEMTLPEANEFKIQFAKLVPANSWFKGATQQDTFRAQLFKSVSAGFRKEIETHAPEITKLNEAWAVANDLWNLAGKKKAKEFVGGGVGEMVRHGPMATAAEIIKWPVSNTVSKSVRNKITSSLASIGQNDLAKFLTKFLIIKKE